MNDTRINARLDEEAQKQIEYLVQATGQSTSHVVRGAIAVYYAQVRQNRPLPRRLLAMAGKYPSVDGRSDVASNYKQYVADAIEAKYASAHPRQALKPPAAKRSAK